MIADAQGLRRTKPDRVEHRAVVVIAEYTYFRDQREALLLLAIEKFSGRSISLVALALSGLPVHTARIDGARQ